MANFLIAIDRDASRRSTFCAAALPQMAPFEKLVRGDACNGEFAAAWVAGERAPISRSEHANGLSLIWGRPLADSTRTPLDAGALRSAWSNVDELPCFDGYYAAVCYSSRTGLVLGTDILGLFPAYWWCDEEVLVAASSPDVFRHHPRFRQDIDILGLTGLLLMGHAVEGRTLATGVRRLGPGRTLVWRPSEGAREQPHYRPPTSTKYFDLPFSAAVELVNDTLAKAIDRQVPEGAACGLTLSGGRDSRLLAGGMVKAGRRPPALTYGNTADIEVQCASAVAHALGLRHTVREMDLAQAESFARLHARVLHCSTGFNLIEYWSCVNPLWELPDIFASAFAMDFVVGGSHVSWGYSRATGTFSFANLFARNNAYGVPLESLRQLLRTDVFEGAVDTVISQLEQTYNNYDGFEAQRAWWFDLHHRVRFYTATFPWQLSFASWPVLPTVDKVLFEVTGGLPPGLLSERGLQDAILTRHFPVLAELPLDRNSFDTTPLSPRLRHHLKTNIAGQFEPLTRPLSRLRSRRRDPRIYYRIFDFNGPAWKAVRRIAEPNRERLYAFFKKDALDRYLPHADDDVKMEDGIISSSGRKLMVGLALWAGGQ
jgi:asparagine synthase (glutamine-hydrolysing)